MVPPPVALGLILCDYVIVEERTRKVSLIGTFTVIRAASFPALAQPFSAFALLTDGQGDARITLSVSQLQTQEAVYRREMVGLFTDKLAELRVHFRVSQCPFPAPGWYQVTLLVDGDWVAQRLIRVLPAEDSQ
jgi:hypothetical protein